MGSWNGTCGISQLPILYGDKVKLFVLVKKEYDIDGGGTCYPTDLWEPLGGAISGVYDDYGCIEKIVENEAANKLLKKLKEHWVEFEEKYEQPSPLDKMDLKEHIHWIERGKARICKYKYISEKPVPLGIFMILDKVYTELIKFIRKDTILEDFTDDMIISTSLNRLRKMWIPQSGQGSQFGTFPDETRIYEVLNNVTSKILKRREIKHIKEYGNDE